MIVPLAPMLRLASAALPLLLSLQGALPSMPVGAIAHRASAAASYVLDAVASLERVSTSSVSHGPTVQTSSATDTTRPAAGAALAPPASGSKGRNTGSGATGASGGSTGSSQGGSTGSPQGGSGSAGSSGEAKSSSSGHHGSSESSGSDSEDGDRDDYRYTEEGGPDSDRGTMRRSITPDVSFGMNPVHVPAGEYHRGNIVCIGGDVTIDGEVRGDVVVVGGVLTISGTVRGDVVAVASKAYLRDTARLRHDFISVSGPIERAPDAQIRGEYHSIDLPNLGQFATGHGVFLYLLSLFLWVGVIFTAFRFMAVLVVAAIAPGRIEGALGAPRVSWIFAFFLGFIVHLFAGLVSFILILGIVTSPIGFALWLGVRVVVWMGLAAIYLEIGRNISKTAFGNRLSYFGSILLGFSIFAVVGLIPIIGWFVTGILSSTALGLMLLTRFGNPSRLVPAVAPVLAAAPVRETPPAAPPQGATPESAR